jgi:small subunit ribosomal protein S9
MSDPSEREPENEQESQVGDAEAAAPAPEGEQAEAPAEESEEAAAPQGEEQPEKEPEEAAGPQAEEAPEAPEGDAEAPAEDEPKPERRPKPEPSEGREKGKEAVPGANLEPIAITEERELTAEERARLEAEEEERARREAAAKADEDEELPRRAAVSIPTDASIQATGKRKNAVARALLRAGDGSIEVNGRGLEDYFPRAHHQSVARQPLITAGYDGNLDVRVRVHGGGITGQAGAIRHGIARALCELDPELRRDLKKRGMLTRDAREKERRKAGLKKARKRPQFSKR